MEDQPAEAPPLARALAYFCHRCRWSPQRLAAAHGFADHRQVHGYLSGDRPLSREYLEHLLAPLEVPPEAIDTFLFSDGLIVLAPPLQAASPVALDREEQQAIDQTVMTAGWTLAEALRRELIREAKKEKAEAARRQARELWADLKAADAQERRDLVEVFPVYRSWALAELLCHESERMASHKVEVALELAELAVLVAERVQEEERWRSLLLAYCHAHIANARRVATDFDTADEAFARALELWRAGQEVDPCPLAEWRMLDLESSLRREQHRFQEALDLLEQALAASGEDRSAKGRIFLKKEHVFDQMGDLQGALAAMEEAAPWVEAAGDPHLIFSLRFKEANNLCHQERHADAEKLLGRVRELAVEQGSELNLIRVGWLASKIDAGQGRSAEAIAGLEQVRRDFTVRGLPYEAALSSLDLALLWLREGRRKEVRDLALAMAWIFRAKKIHREALAALSLFCEAAKQDAATVELTQQVIAEIERVKRSAPRSGDGSGGRE
jgi:tetratricopeptide (TPR) repeat protein